MILDKWKYGHTSEDNLYLNVFTPVWALPADGFPVMVFVHGGGFVSDSSVKYGDVGICRHLVCAWRLTTLLTDALILRYSLLTDVVSVLSFYFTWDGFERLHCGYPLFEAMKIPLGVLLFFSLVKYYS